MTPRVSVIIPAYNAARFLSATIASVRAQTIEDWELLVIDDGSTDATSEIAGAHATDDARIRVFSIENGGVAAARNFGLAHANRAGEFVAFLDADDLYDPDALETLIDALSARPDALAAHGLARYIDEHGELVRSGEAEHWGRERRSVRGLRSVPWPNYAPTTLAVLAHWNTILTPGQVVVRKRALERVGGSDITLAVAADYDFWLRLLSLGDFAFVDRVTLSYRQHQGGISRDQRKMGLETWQVVRRLLETPNLSEEQRKDCLVAAFHSPLLMRLGWAKDAFRRGELGPVIREVRSLVGAYVRLAGVLPGLVVPKPLTAVRPGSSSALD